VPPDPATTRVLASEAGTPLPTALRGLLQTRFETDLSDVRLHLDEPAEREAVRLNANAFTIGQDIAFAPEHYQPATGEGQRLVAHEVAHTLQQRESSDGPSTASDLSVSETEARSAADRVSQAPGARVQIPRRPETRGRIQRDGPYQPASRLQPWSSQGDFQLHLDPEIEAEIARIQFQRWLEQIAQGGGDAANQATPASGPGDAAASSGSAGSVAGEKTGEGSESSGLGGGVTSHDPVPRAWLSIEGMGAESVDFGAFFTPYFNRGLLPNAVGDTRDLDVIGSLFEQRYSLVSQLPDVRLFLPQFARQWVPDNWRVGLASALTSTTIDWALSGQHPTMFEVSNRLWDFQHGTTTIFTPQISMPFVSGWWNDISSGRAPR
jgi:hypothetical protein